MLDNINVKPGKWNRIEYYKPSSDDKVLFCTWRSSSCLTKSTLIPSVIPWSCWVLSVIPIKMRECIMACHITGMYSCVFTITIFNQGSCLVYCRENITLNRFSILHSRCMVRRDIHWCRFQCIESFSFIQPYKRGVFLGESRPSKTSGIAYSGQWLEIIPWKSSEHIHFTLESN